MAKSKRQGISAAAWFYGQPGFRNTETHIHVCAGCGASINPDGTSCRDCRPLDLAAKLRQAGCQCAPRTTQVSR